MKKNWNVAKVFTLLITVLFLASTLFVGCKNQEPTPEPEPTEYMVTYVTDPEGLEVEDFPTIGEVEENTTIELPVLTLEGYTFVGWFDGDTKVDSPYKVTKAVTLTAKFTENVAPDLPAGGEEGGTTPPAGGEEGGTTPPAGGEEGGTTPPAGGEEGGTTPPAGGEEGGTTPPAGGEEGGTTPPAGGEEGGTTPPAGGEEGGTTPPAGEGGEGGVIPDPDPVDPDPVVTFSVTYTVEGIESTLVTDLPKSGDVNKDTVLTLCPLTAPEGYVFDGWFIDDVGVSEYTVLAAVTIVAKFSVPQVDPEPTGTTYTITDVPDIWEEIGSDIGNLYVYVFDSNGTAWIPAIYENNTLKYESEIAYEKCIAVISDGEPLGDWSNIKLQSNNMLVSDKTAVLAFTSLKDLSLRGSFNEWGLSSLLTDDVCNTCYSVNLSTGGEIEFKVASSDWGTGYGYGILQGVNVDISGDNNAKMTIPENGCTLTFFAIQNDDGYLTKIFVYAK